MKRLVKKHFLIIIGAIAGAMGGYYYWKFAGCSSSSCAITSNPLNSSIYGTVMGGLLFSIFRKDKKK